MALTRPRAGFPSGGCAALGPSLLRFAPSLRSIRRARSTPAQGFASAPKNPARSPSINGHKEPGAALGPRAAPTRGARRLRIAPTAAPDKKQNTRKAIHYQPENLSKHRTSCGGYTAFIAMNLHPKLCEAMRSTANNLEHSPDLTPEDTGKIKQVIVHLAAELEVSKAEPLETFPSTAATDD